MEFKIWTIKYGIKGNMSSLIIWSKMISIRKEQSKGLEIM